MNVKASMLNFCVNGLKNCPDGFTVASTFEEAIFYFNNNIADILALDYGMGEDNQGEIF